MTMTRKEHGLIAGALLAVIILATSTSGCVSQTPSPSPTPHDALVEGLVSAQHNQTAGNAAIVTWNVTWNNSTTVSIQFAAHNQTQNATISGNRTFMRFSSTDAATSFVNSSNLTGYTLTSNVPASTPGFLNFTLSRLYENVTGHPPTQYRMYFKQSEGQGTFTIVALAQADDVISTFTFTVNSANVPALRVSGTTTASPLPSVFSTTTSTPSLSPSVVNTTTATVPL